MLFGDPEKIEKVNVTIEERFQKLDDRAVDLLLYGDAYTIEREIREVRSAPISLDFVSFHGF